MSDLLDDDLEFRIGTLQLSSDNVATNAEDRRENASGNAKTAPVNVPPSSVLSGADSLTSSSSSFAGKENYVYS